MPDAAVPLPLSDLSTVDTVARERAVAEAAGRFGAEPIDVTRELPLRLRLLLLGPREHVLVLVLHHIACDDATWEVLLGEVAELYAARRAGRAPRLAELPIQYADFAAWEQRQLRSGRWAGQLDYWRTRLTPVPAPLALLAGGRRPAHPSDAGERRSVTVPATVRSRVVEIGRQEGCTPFMVLLAAFLAVIHRYGGGTDVAVGSPVVNRDRSELRGLAGNFGNTIVLRTGLDGDPSFRDLLGRVRRTCVDGYTHQELPFDRLVDHLAVDRGEGQNPIFDVLFSTRSGVFGGFTLPGLQTSEVEVDNGTARFDLSLQVRDTGTELVLTLIHRTELYSADTAGRLLDHLCVLLEGAAGDPTTRLSRLPLLTKDERRWILHELNGTRRAEPWPDRSLTGMVERQVAATPDRVAVIAGDATLTYRELDARANRLARYLRSAGIGQEAVVGVHLNRSVELVVALLAVLKAGGAYLPLEPAWPGHRRSEVADGAGLAAVLHHPDSGDLPPGLGVPVVDLHADRALIGTHADSDLGVPIDPESLAFVLYTSGSTGRPKGVMTPHRAIVNRLSWQREVLAVDETDAVLHKAPPGFDVSASEIFLPLAGGARLVVAKPDGERDPAYLFDTIDRHRITFVYLVPAMLEVLLERPDFAGRAGSLRYVWSGGEVLTPELFARFRQRFPELPMYHSYGLAETTITATCEAYTGTRERLDTTVGRPIVNTRCYVLDRYLNLVPPGVVGDLYVGGAQLARGYRGEPALTASRFVPDLFDDAPGAILYRTGDLGRLTPDGSVEFLGRADNQVKIRGLRIEPEEIEAKLKSCPGIRRSAVVVRREGPGVTRLIAYCVPTEPAGGDEDAVRNWLSSRLPDYMVPGHVVFVPDLPELPSGKINRRALAERPVSRTGSAPRLEPAQGLERRIAEVWREVLGLDRVDAEENFFDLGGNSLLLLKAQSRLEQELARPVPRVDLFAHTTVRALAAHLSTGDGNQEWTR
jgi:amino acid adenylation domain-containing protein